MNKPVPPPNSSSVSLWQRVTNSGLLRYLLWFGCSWATVLVIDYFYKTIALFTAAGILAALLNYPVVWLSRYLPRGIAIALTFLGALALLFAFIVGIGLEVLNQGQSLLSQLTDVIKQQDSSPFESLFKQLDINKIVATLQTGLSSGLGIIQGVFSSIFVGIFGAVISLYMLIDGDKLWQSFLKLLPPTYRDRFSQAFRQSFLGFIRGQLLLMLFLSVSSFLIFALVGINYSLILAVILGVIDAIPGIGATLGILIITTLAFASQGGKIALWVLIISVVLAQIQDNFVNPKVMGNNLQLNPVLLFLALFIGERIAGLLGVFLSIPIAGMIAIWIRLVKEEAENESLTDK